MIKLDKWLTLLTFIDTFCKKKNGSEKLGWLCKHIYSFRASSHRNLFWMPCHARNLVYIWTD